MGHSRILFRLFSLFFKQPIHFGGSRSSCDSTAALDTSGLGLLLAVCRKDENKKEAENCPLKIMQFYYKLMWKSIWYPVAPFKLKIFIMSSKLAQTFIFIISIQFKVQLIVNGIFRWLDSNRGSLVLEATALPTEPQPLPSWSFCMSHNLLAYHNSPTL